MLATIALASELGLSCFGPLPSFEVGHPAYFKSSHYLLAIVNQVTTQPVLKLVVIFQLLRIGLARLNLAGWL